MNERVRGEFSNGVRRWQLVEEETTSLEISRGREVKVPRTFVLVLGHECFNFW